jgi:hypothetical protein
MNTNSSSADERSKLSRRDALLQALTGGLAAVVAFPNRADAIPSQSHQAAPSPLEAAYAPENDYPFFGATPPSHE